MPDIADFVKDEMSIVQQFQAQRQLTFEDIDCLFGSRSFLQLYDGLSQSEKPSFLTDLTDKDLQRYLAEGEEGKRRMNDLK